MQKILEIDGQKVGDGQPPYIIAEMSGNHNGDIERAKKLIQLAKQAGADAVKLQTYTAESMTFKGFQVEGGKTWQGLDLYKLYEEAHTPWDWFNELFSYAKSIGISIFSSPFDLAAVQLLESLDCPAYKIASNEMTDWPLVEAVIKTGKPVILSTGTSTKKEVAETIKFIEKLGGRDRIIVLHCVSAYPAPAEDTYLGTMLDIRDSFDVLAGLSDHTLGIAIAVAAVSLGACVVEKHFTLDRADGGPDSTFSLEKPELVALCEETKWAWNSLGGLTVRPLEMGTIKYGGDTNLKDKGIFTRQFWTIKNIEEGEIFSFENIKSIRAPVDSGAVKTMNYQSVIGSKAKTSLPKNKPVTLEAIIKK